MAIATQNNSIRLRTFSIFFFLFIMILGINACDNDNGGAGNHTPASRSSVRILCINGDGTEMSPIADATCRLVNFNGSAILNLSQEPIVGTTDQNGHFFLEDVPLDSGERISVPFKESYKSRLTAQVDPVGAKAALLLNLIREALAKWPNANLFIDGLLSYEAEHNLESVEGRAENRFTFYNFLLGRLESGTAADADNLMDDYKVYAQRCWIHLASIGHKNSKAFSENHQQKVFEWQLFSSKIIFWTVILSVAAGLFFSGVQFYHAFKKSDRPVLSPNQSYQDRKHQPARFNTCP